MADRKQLRNPSSTPSRRFAAGFGFIQSELDNTMPQQTGSSMDDVVDDDVGAMSVAAIEQRVMEANERRFKQMEESLMLSIRTLLHNSGVAVDGAVGGGDDGGADRRSHHRSSGTPRGDADGVANRGRINVGSIEKLEGDVTLQEFQTWRNRWNDLVRLERIGDHSAAEQSAALRMCFAPSMQQIVEVALNILPTSGKTPAQVLDKIYEHIRGKRNVALDRVEFEMCRQEPNESFDDFYIRLKRIADCAQLCAGCFETRLATRIMSGISDSSVRQKLLAHTPFPTLKQVVNLCRSEESAIRSGVQLNNRQVSKLAGRSKNNKPRDDATKSDMESCKACGRAAHVGEEKCPAIGRPCSFCKQLGHFAKVCPDKTKSDPKSASSSSSTGHTHVAGTVSVARLSAAQQAPRIQLDVLDPDGSATNVSATPDSGADIVVAGLDFLHDIDGYIENLLPAEIDLVTATYTKMEVIGRHPATFRYFDRVVTTDVIISPEVKSVLLGWQICKEFGILHPSYPEPYVREKGAAEVTPTLCLRSEIFVPEANVLVPERPVVCSSIGAVSEHQDVYEPTPAELPWTVVSSKRARKLSSLGVGVPVRVREPVNKLWSREGFIIAIGRYGDYRVKFSDGRLQWRKPRSIRAKLPIN